MDTEDLKQVVHNVVSRQLIPDETSDEVWFSLIRALWRSVYETHWVPVLFQLGHLHGEE